MNAQLHRAVVCPLASAIIVAIAVGIGCTSTNDQKTGDDQNVTGACAVVTADGKPMAAQDLAKLDDPVATRILAGGCPQTLDAIFETLAKSPGCKSSSFSTHLISERAFDLGKADIYRGVVAQDCTGGTGHDLFVSVFGIDPAAAQLPQQGTELIGKTTSGVFDFYVHENNTWKFMGSSADAVSSGYTCSAKGDCEPNAAKKARCWACHEGGGLNMKEIKSPWSGWDTVNGPPAGGPNVKGTVPGGDQVFKKFGKQLGNRADASDLETRIEAGNTEWDKNRVEVLKALPNAVEELLRPLFCTLTSNLQTGGGNLVANEVFIDQVDNGFVGFKTIGFRPSTFGVNIDDGTIYQTLIAANGQKIVDRNGQQLTGLKGPLLDTSGGFMFVTKGDVDHRFITALVAANIIDEDFAFDVIDIDFTRPVFSSRRCALLAAAPKLTRANITPKAIRAGFIANLASAGGAAPQLLANLANTNDAAAHQKDVADFFAGCDRRTDKRALMADVIQFNDGVKAALKAHRIQTPDGVQGIIEFSETLPIDKLSPNGKSFDGTCAFK